MADFPIGQELPRCRSDGDGDSFVGQAPAPTRPARATGQVFRWECPEGCAPVAAEPYGGIKLMYIHLHGLAQPSGPSPQPVIPRPPPVPMPKPLAPPPAAPRPRTCDNRSIPSREPIRPFTASRVGCASVVFGEPDPVGVLRAAVARAIEMLDNTIEELVHARDRVCQGETPAWPLLGDITLCWLQNGLSVNVDDIRVWTAGTFVNRSVAEVIRRPTRARNLIASNAIQYVCGGRCNPANPASGCDPDDWAFVCRPKPCPSGSIPAIIHLCRLFWEPAPGVGRAVHAEFQAQTIIHEASHLYHCTEDLRGSTIGVAECLAQFVAATNDSPIDPGFADRCVGAARCLPAAGAGRPGVSGLGLARPDSGSVRIVRTIFRPMNAIRLKGRPAARR
jgi:hypothetical protein